MGTTHGGIRRVTALGRRIVALAAIALLTFSTASCAKPTQPTELISEPTPQPNRLTGQIAEVSPPAALETLKQIIDAYTPQVRLLSPRPGEVLSDTTATVKLQVRGLPLFKNDDWQLGPHLHLLLDNEPYRAIYDLSEPITFENLAPGTHTLRVFASRPWHESFKNQGAFDQRTFHVVAPTPQNELNANTPLLTYSRPQSTYGAEPIMLDFYLTNAPLHMSAQADANDDLHDWRIRCTVNDQSFVFDQWQPLWLKGFKPGRNWVQLELIDESGNPIDNRFNNTVRIIDYQPGGSDTLSRLVRGELDMQAVAGIIDPTYLPPAPPEPEAEGKNAAPEAATAPAASPRQQSAEAEVGQASSGEASTEASQLEPDRQKNQPPSTELDTPNPASRDGLPAAALDDAVQPQPFQRPEQPSKPTVDAEAPAAPEDSGMTTPPDGLFEALEQSAETLSPPADDSAPQGAEGPEEPADLAIPPILLEPEGRAEPQPRRAQPLDRPEEPSPEPAAQGLIDRFKQWRSQSAPDAPSSVAPAAKPEDLFSRPQPDSEGLLSPAPESSEAAAPDDAPQLPRALPKATPKLAEPYTPAPSQTVPPIEQAPAGDEPELQDAVEPPATAPRSPVAPEVRPFI